MHSCLCNNQVAGEEVKLDPGAGLVLSCGSSWCGGSPHEDYDASDGSPVLGSASPVAGGGVDSSSSLAHTLESLSRPVLVTAPPPRMLIFVWLLAAGIPRAQVSSVLYGNGIVYLSKNKIKDSYKGSV